jgi:hypothetical protein
VVVNPPRFTSNPPQIHHDLPPRSTTKIAKPPAKRHFTTPEKNHFEFKASAG